MSQGSGSQKEEQEEPRTVLTAEQIKKGLSKIAKTFGK